MVQTDVASALSAALRDHGLAHADVAQAARVDPKTVARWVSGESNPPKRKVSAALQVLGIDPSTYGLRRTGVSPDLSMFPEAPPEWLVTEFAQHKAALKAISDKLDVLLSR